MRKIANIKNDVVLNPIQDRVVNDNARRNIILAHPVGSGKTLSGLGKFEKLKQQGLANKALVVTPAGLRHNYAEQGVGKFTNSSANIVGNKQELSKKTAYPINLDSDYNVISYEMFRKDPHKYLDESGADTIIADEIHKIKNEGTSTLRAFKDTRSKYNNFIGLTGSVISNGISDVYNLVDMASGGEHELGKSKKDFDDNFLRRSNSVKYKGLSEKRKPVVGFNNKKLLKSQLDKYIDYVSMDTVRPIAKIPNKILKEKKVEISKDQANAYKGLLKQNPKMLELVTKKRYEVLKDDELARAFTEFIEARKLMNSYGSVIPGVKLGRDNEKKSPKLKTMLDDMENHLKETKDGRAILLTHMIKGGVDALESSLKDRNIEYGKFIGKGNEGVTEESRQQDVNDYNDMKKRVMVISSAGAEGLSLNDTTWEGVFDPHYNPEKMNQMEARGIRARGLSHREEKDRNVLVNRYLATMPKKFGFVKDIRATPDEAIYDIAKLKDRNNKMLFDLLEENNKEKARKKKFKNFFK